MTSKTIAYRPTIFNRTPQEHIYNQMLADERNAEKAFLKATARGKYRIEESSGAYDPFADAKDNQTGQGSNQVMVEVHYYAEIGMIHHQELPCMRGKVALNPSKDGGLDLNDIRRMWGLWDIAIVDPARWKYVPLADPNTLSCVMVWNMTEGMTRPLMITEPRTSKYIAYTRAIRLLFLLPFRTFYIVAYLILLRLPDLPFVVSAKEQIDLEITVAKDHFQIAKEFVYDELRNMVETFMFQFSVIWALIFSKCFTTMPFLKRFVDEKTIRNSTARAREYDDFGWIDLAMLISLILFIMCTVGVLYDIITPICTWYKSNSNWIMNAYSQVGIAGFAGSVY